MEQLAEMTAEQFKWRMRAAVVGWLRYEKGCFMACWERSPFGESFYRPDIVGIEKRWRLIEVEVKQSVGDFKANGRKRGFKLQYQFPWQFWFAVPRKLVDRVQPFLGSGQGLLALEETDGKHGPRVEIVVPADCNKAATKLSRWEVGRMVMHQSGSLHRAAKALAEQVT